MSRRRGERRHIYANVPTSDGKKVAVRSSTIAGRLFAQQQVIEQQVERIAALEADLKKQGSELANARGVRDHLRELTRHITHQRLVRVLVWLRLISIVVPEKPASTEIKVRVSVEGADEAVAALRSVGAAAGQP